MRRIWEDLKCSFLHRNTKRSGLCVHLEFFAWQDYRKRLNVSLHKIELVNRNLGRGVYFPLQNDEVVDIWFCVFYRALLDEFDRDDFFVGDIEIK